MKKLLILIVVLLAGCGTNNDANVDPEKVISESKETISQVKKAIAENEAKELIIKEFSLDLYQSAILLRDNRLDLPDLNSITDHQAEILSKVHQLELNGLISITAKQAESLSKVQALELNGLTAITDKQAESLTKVKYLFISDACQKLVDKYKKP